MWTVDRLEVVVELLAADRGRLVVDHLQERFAGEGVERAGDRDVASAVGAQRQAVLGVAVSGFGPVGIGRQQPVGQMLQPAGELERAGCVDMQLLIADQQLMDPRVVGFTQLVDVGLGERPLRPCGGQLREVGQPQTVRLRRRDRRGRAVRERRQIRCRRAA